MLTGDHDFTIDWFNIAAGQLGNSVPNYFVEKRCVGPDVVLVWRVLTVQ